MGGEAPRCAERCAAASRKNDLVRLLTALDRVDANVSRLGFQLRISSRGLPLDGDSEALKSEGKDCS